VNWATLPLSLSDNLRTSFHPDCDFVDGEVVARNLGDSITPQFCWFIHRRQEWGLRVLPEIRIRVSERRVQSADVCLV